MYPHIIKLVDKFHLTYTIWLANILFFFFRVQTSFSCLRNIKTISLYYRIRYHHKTSSESLKFSFLFEFLLDFKSLKTTMSIQFALQQDLYYSGYCQKSWKQQAWEHKNYIESWQQIFYSNVCSNALLNIQEIYFVNARKIFTWFLFV